MRRRNTTTSGSGFSQNTIDVVWKKATFSSRYPGYRQDACGAYIKKNAYGTTAEHGWEIDHIKPVALGGSDVLSNLQPLHWSNNRHKSDNFPHWSCYIRN